MTVKVPHILILAITHLCEVNLQTEFVSIEDWLYIDVFPLFIPILLNELLIDFMIDQRFNP